jgi:hypothetical protein
MNQGDTEYLLKQAAFRAVEFDFFLAKILRMYEKLENLNSLEVAQNLGCTPDTLTRLALCRRPDSNDPHKFKADVERIADHFNLDSIKLANLVRYVETMQNLSQSPELADTVVDQGMLLTARDEDLPSEPERPDTGSSEDEKDEIDQENGN